MHSVIDRLSVLSQQGRAFTQRLAVTATGIAAMLAGRLGDESSAWITWKTRVRNTLKDVLVDTSSPLQVLAAADELRSRQSFDEIFEQQKQLYLTAISETIGILRDDVYGEKRGSVSNRLPSVSDRVFVVHGHDHEVLEELELFLRHIGLTPIILHQQPDEGRTIIEKLEEYSDVGYAFVILTRDEVAYTVDQERLPDEDRKLEGRARPNVILEFGYFAGHLGRRRVCCLTKGDVAFPSDMQGLLHKKVTSTVEAIGDELIGELKAAGYQITNGTK